MPKQVSVLKRKFSSQSVPRGQGVYIRDGILAYAIWKDTKCVSVMSSEHPGHSTQMVTRNCKDKDGKRLKQDVPIPVMVYEYNCFMSGVDGSDQMIKYYNVLRQTKKYWKTLFFHYIDGAVLNSYILYKEMNASGTLMSHYSFWEMLVKQLCIVQPPLQQSPAGRKALPKES